MRQPTTLKRNGGPAWTAQAAEPDEMALKVAVVYQDPLTRHWANELWERVGNLMGSVSSCRESWDMGRLAEPEVLASAVEAAAKADVVMIAVRGAGELPLALHEWIGAWVPLRARRAGALVALIGLPPQPSPESHHTLRFLEAVARQAGLDFLPRERKLPEELFSATATVPWLGEGLGQRGVAPLRWGLHE